MVTLQNEYLKVSVRLKGAEMTSLYNKQTNTELLWQADASIWGWHSPNLFPVVGGCINNQIIINGLAYPMERHGFARHSEFVVVESGVTHAKLSLEQNETTLRAFPFKFSFQVLYELTGAELKVTFKVINYDDRTIHFSVGAHPAFNVPLFAGENLEDYFLEFEYDEPLRSHALSPSGFFTGLTEEVSRTNNTLPLTKSLFDKDALVFKDLKSRKLSLKTSKHANSITIEYPHFDYLGIWAKSGAPFICLEPWIGCADTEGKAVEFSEKEGVHSLEMGHVFEADYTIRVN